MGTADAAKIDLPPGFTRPPGMPGAAPLLGAALDGTGGRGTAGVPPFVPTVAPAATGGTTHVPQGRGLFGVKLTSLADPGTGAPGAPRLAALPGEAAPPPPGLPGLGWGMPTAGSLFGQAVPGTRVRPADAAAGAGGPQVIRPLPTWQEMAAARTAGPAAGAGAAEMAETSTSFPE